MQYSCASSEDSAATAGAETCTLCPADRPFTRSVGQKTVADCMRCPDGQFYSDVLQGCHACQPECVGPEMYESVACTDDTDRVCEPCDYYSCSLVGEYVDYSRGCPGTYCVHDHEPMYAVMFGQPRGVQVRTVYMIMNQAYSSLLHSNKVHHL